MIVSYFKRVEDTRPESPDMMAFGIYADEAKGP